MSSVSCPPKSRSRGGRSLAWIGLTFVGSFIWFGFRLDSEPLFVDEAAFLSQSYYGDLFVAREWNSPLWLEYPGYDLPPFPKYLINGSLRLHGLSRPNRDAMIRWYRNTKERRFVTPENLRAARWPSVLLAAIGCVAVMAIGTMTVDRRVGVLTAMLLAVNPLYMLHARRAMADVPAEAFVVLSMLTGLCLLRALQRFPVKSGGSPNRVIGLSIVVGLFGGLAVLTKLNGGLALMIVTAWLVALPIIRREVWGRCLLSLVLIGVTSAAMFVAVNPFVTARPKSLGTVRLIAPKPIRESISTRLAEVIEHRASVSISAQDQFPNDALKTIGDKAKALAVQGYGRFGPLGPRHSDSTKRYDLAQDWGAAIWLPLVAAGFLRYCRLGWTSRRNEEPSLAWVVPVAYCVALLTVGLFLPLAWDRYFLPIQSGSCLLAAGAVVGVVDSLRQREVRR